MLTLFQVDAFADRLFAGNPAAVVPLDAWPDDSVLQNIAMENNLAETAFIIPIANAADQCQYELRWFTPLSEVALCGHATLATAHVLIHHLGFKEEVINFRTRQSGVLTVSQAANGQLSMSFPSIPLNRSADTEKVAFALGIEPRSLYVGYYSEDEYDYVAVFDSESLVAENSPNQGNFRELDSRGVIVTAAGDQCDFVSRYFAPMFGVDEDPVTGSAHCLLAPYWAEALGKAELHARQISSRGGKLVCKVDNDRTIITGSCVDYMNGTINVAIDD